MPERAGVARSARELSRVAMAEVLHLATAWDRIDHDPAPYVRAHALAVAELVLLVEAKDAEAARLRRALNGDFDA